MKKLIKIKFLILYVIIYIIMLYTNVYSLTKNTYDVFLEEKRISSYNMEFIPKAQMYRKFGHFILGSDYSPTGDPADPLSNTGDRNLATDAKTGDGVYQVYGIIDEDKMDYSYLDDEDLTSLEYDRAELQARINALYDDGIGNTMINATGYGKYNLRPGKNLNAFINFAYNFYKNESGESRVGMKNLKTVLDAGIDSDRICPMEELAPYASLAYTDAGGFKGFENFWKDCTKHWDYNGNYDLGDNIFENLQDIFMVYVYLRPVILKYFKSENEDFDEQDRAAIMSMVYERYGGRSIAYNKVESSDGAFKIGKGDILPLFIDYPDMKPAEKIYTYMIEIKYKNNEEKLASWLEEYADVVGGEYQVLDPDKYDSFKKAYSKAYSEHGSDRAKDTIIDYTIYGDVENPSIFESKISLEKAITKFANSLKSYFSGSSFFNKAGNPEYVAKSYVMAKKMCENSAFCDITDIYATDIMLVEHSVGYETNKIMLSDTQIVELEEPYEVGNEVDSDDDGLYDYKEAYKKESMDVTNLIREYCKYNEINETDKINNMLTEYGKMDTYVYSSNPILPDSDFDGRIDGIEVENNRLNNNYSYTIDTDNFGTTSSNFAMDYRYFFMDNKNYYQELAKMSLMFSSMINKNKDNRSKTFKNNNKGEIETKQGIREFMSYFGMKHIDEHLNSFLVFGESNVPYIFGQHDTIALKGHVNNLCRNIITCVIGENKDYKDYLSARFNFDNNTGDFRSYHHSGFDKEADEIYNELLDYISENNDNDWKVSYWITGVGTGGAIANLVAKKLIEHNGARDNLYCYTFNAPNFINTNDIDDKIYNKNYQSIFNIENSDNVLLTLLGELNGYKKYGVIKRLNLSEKKYIDELCKTIVKKYNEATKKNISSIKDIDMKEVIKAYHYYALYERNSNSFINFSLNNKLDEIRNSITDDTLLNIGNFIYYDSINKQNGSTDFTKLNILLDKNLETINNDVIYKNMVNMSVQDYLDRLFEWCEKFKGCLYKNGSKPINIYGELNNTNLNIDINDSISNEDKTMIEFDCSGYVGAMYALTAKSFNYKKAVDPAFGKIYVDATENSKKMLDNTSVERIAARCKEKATVIYAKDCDNSLINTKKFANVSSGKYINFDNYITNYTDIYEDIYGYKPETDLLSSGDDNDKLIKPGDLLCIKEGGGNDHISIIKREDANPRYDASRNIIGYEDYVIEVWHADGGINPKGVKHSLFSKSSTLVPDSYDGVLNDDFKTYSTDLTYNKNSYIFRVLDWRN